MTRDAKTTATKLWTVLVRATHSMGEVLEASVAEEGLGLSDFAVMEVLLHKGALPISTIGQKVLLTNASMTSAVDRLEERGLVKRVSSLEDRRVRVVSLTACGRRLITDVFSRHEQEIERIMTGLSAADRDRMRSGLKTIGFAAKAMHEERTAARKARGREERLAKDRLEEERLAEKERLGEERLAG